MKDIFPFLLQIPEFVEGCRNNEKKKNVKRIEEANINLPNAKRHLVEAVLITCLIVVMN